MAWLAFGGEQDPATKGPMLQAAAGQKSLYPCPSVEFADMVMRTDRVAKRFCGGIYEDAETMRQTRPTTFESLLQFANAEIEAEPIALDWARAKADQKAKHQQAAQVGADIGGKADGPPPGASLQEIASYYEAKAKKG